MTKDAYTLTSPDGSSTINLPLREGTIGPDGLDISHLYRDAGVFTHDMGFLATASCQSDITLQVATTSQWAPARMAKSRTIGAPSGATRSRPIR